MKTDQNKYKSVKNKRCLDGIFFRTLFSGEIEICKEKALELAKTKMKMISTGKNDLDRLDMVNKRFRGIKFNLRDLE